ncbi:hypothetical protein PCANC_10144 [Puccinia coronata f. sp. avenae]|uniref:Uncharacterized protein n=1 Tax=Puccinia coronata f. sp. avenae TaxID=200324 RepID=A0A2N5VGR2_9BASI|nr:hypothetical protein PCASD_13274 [Puccinia coronata f. sp. avenae]PLW20347.1 hypothetical protein PCANC_08479 [Puccinia coronata f. sp. avenae]PLW45525.1 hypothetical protein PCANC_10144 [Puccinia coronata f. sp. avenae]PLW49162.1 hypothetical protein PCASD_02981 [Puccinia coronata f. sp. avenae]
MPSLEPLEVMQHHQQESGLPTLHLAGSSRNLISSTQQMIPSLPLASHHLRLGTAEASYEQPTLSLPPSQTTMFTANHLPGPANPLLFSFAHHHHKPCSAGNQAKCLGSWEVKNPQGDFNHHPHHHHPHHHHPHHHHPHPHHPHHYHHHHQMQ